MIVASLALAGVPTSASATIVSVTYTGTVTGDQDQTGIFGTVNGTNDLVGKTYTSNFIFDIPKGIPQNSPPPNASQGYFGNDLLFTVPPAISATVTIGVTTVDLGHIDSAEIIAHQSPTSSDQMHNAADTFRFPYSYGTTSSQSLVSGPAGSVPFTLTGPFTYIPSASGGTGSQSFFEDACLLTGCLISTGVQANVLSLTVGQAQYTWGGAGSSTTTNDYNLATNWSNPPAAAPPVAAGQTAIFANTGSVTVTVTSGPIAPDSWTFNANAQSYTISGANVNFSLAGPTGGIIDNANAGQTITIANNIGESVAGVAVQQLGNSTLVLTGANTYTGGTTISAGTLQLGNGGTTGSIVGNVLDNGVFAIDHSDAVTFAGAISGTGAFLQIGSGTTTLTGTNTYTGLTTVTAGTLTISSTGSITSNVTNNATFNNAGGTISGAVTNNAGATFNFNGGLVRDLLTNNGLVNVNGNSSVDFGIANNGQLNILGGLSTTGSTDNTAGATLAIGTNATLQTTLFRNAGTVTLAGGSQLAADPFGIQNFAGGNIAVSQGATIFAANAGVGGLDNAGQFTSNGTATVDVNFNTGTIVNGPGGTWKGRFDTNAGMITNNGAWTAVYFSVNLFSTNSGTFVNNGTYSSGITDPTVYNTVNSGTLVNTGTFNSSLSNTAGSASNSGTMNGNVLISGGTPLQHRNHQWRFDQRRRRQRQWRRDQRRDHQQSGCDVHRRRHRNR